MYGLVNRAIAGLVRSTYGDELWDEIRASAGVTDDLFLAMEAYPDELTYRLVAATAKAIKWSPNQVLEAFGEYWVLYTAKEGYGDLLRVAGRNLPEVLQRLDAMHAELAITMPHLKPPRFSCTNIEAHSLQLHYFSDREGLAPMVVGLLRGLSKLYETDVQIEQTASRATGAPHDIFLVSF